MKIAIDELRNSPYHQQFARKLCAAFVAQQQGITLGTALKKVPEPKSVTSGGMTVHLWTETEIEAVRQLLPKIANGRKTRYQKLKEKQKKTQPRAAALQKKQKTKKKK